MQSLERHIQGPGYLFSSAILLLICTAQLEDTANLNKVTHCAFPHFSSANLDLKDFGFLC